MSEQVIELKFNKTLTKLAGNPFGRATYDNQVKGKINFSSAVKFVFPDRIDRVASSFIQGFFVEIMQELGLEGIKNKVDFQTSIPDFKKFVIDNLE